MKDTTRENPPDSAGDKRDASRDSPLAAYTPQQRKTIIKGWSILARVAIRSYMREQAEQNQDAHGTSVGRMADSTSYNAHHSRIQRRCR